MQWIPIKSGSILYDRLFHHVGSFEIPSDGSLSSAQEGNRLARSSYAFYLRLAFGEIFIKNEPNSRRPKRISRVSFAIRRSWISGNLLPISFRSRIKNRGRETHSNVPFRRKTSSRRLFCQLWKSD